MTALSITLPLARASPLYIPRRDLVLSSADSLTLAVTVLETDDPSAASVALADGYALRMAVWRDAGGAHSWWHWDYGHPCFDVRELLWTGDGVQGPLGGFLITMPPATMHGWPRRCGWSIAMTSFDGGEIDTLAHGTLIVRRAVDGSAAVGLGSVVVPPVPPPTVGPIVTVPFTLDLSQLDMGAMVDGGTGGIGGQPGGVGVGVFVMDDSRLDMGVRI